MYINPKPPKNLAWTRFDGEKSKFGLKKIWCKKKPKNGIIKFSTKILKLLEMLENWKTKYSWSTPIFMKIYSIELNHFIRVLELIGHVFQVFLRCRTKREFDRFSINKKLLEFCEFHTWIIIVKFEPLSRLHFFAKKSIPFNCKNRTA